MQLQPAEIKPDIRIKTLREWKDQLKKPKIVKVVGKNRKHKVTVRW